MKRKKYYTEMRETVKKYEKIIDEIKNELMEMENYLARQSQLRKKIEVRVRNLKTICEEKLWYE